MKMAHWLLLAAVGMSCVIGMQWWLGNRSQSLLLAIGMELPIWLTWAAMTPLIFRSGARWALDTKRWYLRFPLHVLFGLTASLVVIAVTVGVRTAVRSGSDRDYIEQVAGGFTATFGFFTLIYFGILALHHSIAYRRAYRASLETQLRMEAELSRAQLRMLQSQLQPHFLFNALNTISSFVTRDARTARVMIVQLSDLLRAALQRSTQYEVSLGDEIAFVETYVAIQQMRFMEQLSIEVDASPASLRAMIPPMILQPLVENSIKFGLARQHHVAVRISARVNSPRLFIEVEDDGPGFQDWRSNRGQGLRSVEALLAEHFADDHQIRYSNRTERGAAVQIDLPYREDVVRSHNQSGDTD